jgi:hypothetical protein
MFLVEGTPGTGKTTIALQFLMESASAGGKCLYITLSEIERRAISIVEKRTGAHEATIREYRIDKRGLAVGGPLVGFQGVLLGVPTYVGQGKPLLEDPLP